MPDSPVLGQLGGVPGIEGLELVERERPPLRARDVRVRVRAVSLNYRDLLTVQLGQRLGAPAGRVPCSDGVGEVIEIGPETTRFAVGESVVASFFPTWVAGEIEAEAYAHSLGGTAADGTLAEEIVLDEAAFLAPPSYLSDEEVATRRVRR